MKTLITLLVSLFVIVGHAQEYYSESGEFHFKDIIDIDGKTQKDLHEASKKWLAVNFKDLNEVLKLDTEKNLVLKGNMTIDNQGETLVEFTMDLAFKNGKVKMEMYDLQAKLKSTKSHIPTMKPDSYTIENYRTEFVETMISAGSTEKAAIKEVEKPIFKEKYWPMMIEYNVKTAEILKNRMNSLSESLQKDLKKDNDGW